jgi:hypothetical protein
MDQVSALWRAPAESATETAPGVEGNSRLTSATGTVLLVMLAVEGYTILDVRGLITLHIFLGVMLVGPVLLKTGSTVYRFFRYYRGDANYVRKGPPNIVLRVIGPLVTISSLSVLGTGIGLLAVHDLGSLVLTAHKASFIVWVALMTVHVLGHLREALVTTWQELRQRSRRQVLRLSLIAIAIVAGVGLAAALLPSATSWTHRAPDSGNHREH